MDELEKEAIEKVRAAIKDRAVWFALIYREFLGVLDSAETERIARKAIREYGKFKAGRDGGKLSAHELLNRFAASGGARVFSAQIELGGEKSENRVGACALVDAWKEMELPPDTVNLFCDIAMEGDRGRAEAHDIEISLFETLGKGDSGCRLVYRQKNGIKNDTSFDKVSADSPVFARDKREMVEKIRAAVKDRAFWFARLYEAFQGVLPEPRVEDLFRKAVFDFGGMKAAKDKRPFSHREWVERHVEKGSSLVFDSDIETRSDRSVQRMKHCPLVEAWKEMGLPPETVAKFCDIAMEGDRGRAAAHGIRMELDETLGKGDAFCRLTVFGAGEESP